MSGRRMTHGACKCNVVGVAVPISFSEWMMGDAVEKVVLAIQAVATQEVLERWTFNIVKEQSESTRDGDDDDEANGKEK